MTARINSGRRHDTPNLMPPFHSCRLPGSRVGMGIVTTTTEKPMQLHSCPTARRAPSPVAALLILALLLIPLPSTAQEAGNARSDTTFSADVALGYFFSDDIAVGSRRSAGYADIEAGDGLGQAAQRSYLDYYFAWGRWQPFIGGTVGYLRSDGVDDTWIAGPEGGIKVLIRQDAYLTGLVEYHFTVEAADRANEAFDDGRFVYTLGLGIRF